MASFNPQQSSSSIAVRNSFGLTQRKVEVPSSGNRSITLGDKMFARLILHGKTILEFIISTVSDLTELYCLLHSKCKGLRGLAKLYLRNMSKGWCEERPLMLYPEERKGVGNGSEASAGYGSSAGRDHYLSTGMNRIKREYKAQPKTNVTIQDVSYGRYFKGEVQQLSFPWQL